MINTKNKLISLKITCNMDEQKEEREKLFQGNNGGHIS